ncbi:MAG: hypothetical protein AAB437_03135, partial [Patescibacteria group bacterium]
IHSTNLITGVVFLSLGIYILYLATTNQITSVTPSQTRLVATMTLIQRKILSFTSGVPDWIFLLIIILIGLGLFIKGKSR